MARLARIAGNYQRTMEQWGMWRPAEHKRCGFRILLHGDYRQGLEAAEGMAAELDRAVDCVALEALVQAGKVSGEEQSLADQVLDGSAGSDRILVIADEGGLMGRLKYQLPDSHLSEVIVRLHNYNGVAVVVTSEESVGLPKWARMFHERVATAGTLDEEARLRCWERALGERVSLSADLDLAVVAREFVLSIAEIEAAAVRAALLVAAGDSGGELGLEAVVEAVEGVGEEGGGVPLFG